MSILTPTTAVDPPRDLSSLGNPHQVRLTHLDWNVRVDFQAKIFRATATYTLQRVVANTDATRLQLDTAHLIIHSVRTPNDNNHKSLPFQLHKADPNKPHLGAQLEIELEPDTTQVVIEYETTAASSAIQWLPPAQTVGKQHPYLFTQCQAIHARTMLPCQDQPGVKMTYAATVTVPSWAVCVMSALLQSETNNSDTTTKTYLWKQPVPISSYLIAMAVGQLAKKDISDRIAIWTEPALVDAAAYEFAQTADFLQIAETIAGMPYVWGRYDLLCLPPSFPYGGMENPCLTAVTPTLLAGDQSLADVVAHEIAHSWTGNLVTNATWEHFWLNEGWTTWFQRKIMARIHNNDLFLDFDALGGYQTLQDTVMGAGAMPEDFQKLVLPIGDQDPDEAYSTVAYEKGFNLLWALERRVGKTAFEAFFQAYLKEYASKTVTSEEFKTFFLEHFQGSDAVNDIDWDTWFYAPGMPPEEPNFDRTLAQASEQLADRWIDLDRNSAPLPTTPDIKTWSSDQITCFLDALLTHTTTGPEHKPLQCSTLNSMNDEYGFASSKNAEILFRYCRLAIAAEDESMLQVIMYFITSQGRMKYVRPLYRALYASKMGKELAVMGFLQNQEFYHPICAKMIAADLMIGREQRGSSALLPRKEKVKSMVKWAVIVGAVAATIGLVLSRRTRR